MTLPLDVPFVPDGDYPDFLADRAGHLSSVHFSMHDPGLADARQLMDRKDRQRIIDGLRRLHGVGKYVLMNARLHAPDRYFDAAGLGRTAEVLETLLEADAVDGLIFADPYYLQAFSDAHPAIAARLEAVPSVNTRLDSAPTLFAMLDMIDRTAFRQPSRIVLDRPLNRDMARLAGVSAAIHAARPTLRLHLIANEGCLYQCPYKPAHDAHIALVNEGLCGERTFAMNRDFGCIRRLLDDPGAMLASPFIRPEDTGAYAPFVDGIKLCGRNKGIEFLKRTVDAYLAGSYMGNLLDLMDAMGDLADRVDIPNEKIPRNFLEIVTSCTKHCAACGRCAAMTGMIAVRKAQAITRL